MDILQKNVFLGLGSNVGDRAGHLQWAVEQLLQVEGICDIVSSSIYESEAHVLAGSAPQSPYLNAVLQCATTRLPDKLLHLLNTFEKERGRDRADEARWAPRTLDLDILAFGELTMQSWSLQIPHRRLGERNFVLVPWAEIAPKFIVPTPFAKSVEMLLDECPDHSQVQLTSRRLHIL